MPRHDAASGSDADRKPAPQRAPFVAITAFLAAGIVAGHYAAFPFAAWAGLMALGLGLAAIALCIRRRTAAAVALLLGFLGLGGALHHCHYFYLPAGHVARIASPERMLAKLHARIRSDPVAILKTPINLAPAGPAEMNYETAFDADVSGIFYGHALAKATGRIKVKLAGRNPGLHYGDEVDIVGQLQTPNTPSNPAQFDYREYLRRQGIRAIIYVSDAAGVQVTAQSHGPWRLVCDVRRHLVSLLKPTPHGVGGQVLGAILLGATEDLPPSVISSFQNSGAMHLVAVSGLNVGMIAVTIWRLVQMLRVPAAGRNFIIVAGVILYTVFAGAQPPVVRAAVMIVVATISGIFDRRHLSINSVALAAFIILLYSPCELFMVGFQLSFLAILGILYFYSPIGNLLNKLRSTLEDLQATEEMSWLLRAWIAARRVAVPLVAVSMAATVGVLPVVAYTFNVVNVSGIICNALFVPFAWFITVAGFLGLGVALPLSLVWSHASLVSTPVAWAALGLEKVVELSTHLPASYYHAASPPAWFLLLYYALLVAIVRRRSLGLSPRRLAIAALLLLNALAFTSLAWPGKPRLEVTALDVRHGNCVWLRFPSGKTALYDCGTQSMFFDVGSYVVAPALWQQGENRIDALLLSHADSDHVNGVASLISRFRIGCVFVPPGFADDPLGGHVLKMITAAGIAHRELAAGQTIDLGDARIDILNPPRNTGVKSGSDSNNRSLVARVSCLGRSLLLTGDIQTPAVSWMLVSGQAMRSDVLFLPHHGASAADCADLCAAVRPEVTIISCDRDGPSGGRLLALEQRGNRAFRTADCGAIRITVDEGGLAAESKLRGSVMSGMQKR